MRYLVVQSEKPVFQNTLRETLLRLRPSGTSGILRPKERRMIHLIL
jgi:hypothetical protein